MKISYKPLWKTLIDRNWSKLELKRQAGLTTNHIANMGKGMHVSLTTIVKICETLNCGLDDSTAEKIKKTLDEIRTTAPTKQRVTDKDLDS